MAKVLLVEDDNNLREIYQARLQAEGYDIVSARDGEEALVVAKQEQPDLVISDVMMPKISGFEMLDILRNTEGLQQVKVIMLTALGQAEDQTRADSLGADRYLVKSQVTLEDIVNAASDLLSQVNGADVAAPATDAAVAAPVTEAAPEPAAPVSAAPEPTPPIIPLATAPPETPEEAVTPSMPPTAEATVPNVPVADEPPADVASATEAVAPITEAVSSAATPAPEPEVPTPSAPEPTTLPTNDAVSDAPVTEDVSSSGPLADAAVEPPTSDPQTNAEETATVEKQIETFVESQSGNPAPEVEPAVDVATPVEPEITTPETTPEQEQALNDALTNLGGASAEPEVSTAPAVPVGGTTPEVASPAPEVQATTATDAPSEEATAPETPGTGRKKVIEPLNDPSEPKKNLDALLAAEDARENGTATPAEQDQKPTAGKGDFDPNSIAL